MLSRGTAAGKPEHTYVGRPQLCHQHARTGPGGLKALTYYLRRTLLTLPSVGADKAHRMQYPHGSRMSIWDRSAYIRAVSVFFGARLKYSRQNYLQVWRQVIVHTAVPPQYVYIIYQK